MARARGVVVIDEGACNGCSLCVHFCPRDCLVIQGDRISPRGYVLPTFVQVERCTACGVCVWMCPPCAIEVYRVVEDEEAKAAIGVVEPAGS